jgi:hypothetical protein
MLALAWTRQDLNHRPVYCDRAFSRFLEESGPFLRLASALNYFAALDFCAPAAFLVLRRVAEP